MIDFFILMSVVFAWLCWQWATDSFENDRKFSGYFWLTMSAYNAATVAALVL